MKGFILSFLVIFSSQVSSAEFDDLAHKCAPDIAIDTLKALIATESSYNQFAIAVVNGVVKQPKDLKNALGTVEKLISNHKNFSLGLGQINVNNFKRLGVTAEDMFDPCKNLQATQQILKECFIQAKNKKEGLSVGKSLGNALSCYYSGNEHTGYEHGYVQSVAKNAPIDSIKVPSIQSLNQELKITAQGGSNQSIVFSSEHKTSLVSSSKTKLV